VQRGDNRVRIRRSIAGHRELVLAQHAPLHAEAAAAPASPSAPPPEPPKEPGADPSLLLVRSPIVGTFYESSAPGTPPFVRVGERVQPGKVLCIIESMKLMNEIEAEVSGIVESKLVMNGQPVEYGEALFAIRAN
jgi:acetyl-CoA carboxylase biotin carboxyl carrier protein